MWREDIPRLKERGNLNGDRRYASNEMNRISELGGHSRVHGEKGANGNPRDLLG